MMHFRSWIYFGCRNFKKFLVIVPIKKHYSINHQVFRIYIYVSIYIYIYIYIYRNSIDIPKKYGQHPGCSRPHPVTPMATPHGKPRTQRSKLRPAASTAADAERSEGARRRSGRARRWRTTSGRGVFFFEG